MEYRKLNEKIEDSGYKKNFIAKELGCCEATFCNKLKGRTPWKITEIYKLESLLNLKKEDIINIFLKK